MSLYSVMRTCVSGMAAQGNKLSVVSDNIANSDTTGYKRSSIEFETLLISGGAQTGDYNSGGVETNVRRSITEQGTISYTTNATDLAVQGNGFFIVSDIAGRTYMTRAGAFVPDGDGYLVNSAGFRLMGFDLANGAPAVIANSLGGFVPVNIDQGGLKATPSTAGTLAGNLPANSTIVAAANLPSTNDATIPTTYTAKTSLVAYDNLGNQVTYDVYFAHSATAPSAIPPTDSWQVAVFNHADSATGTFPYGTTGSAPLASTTLTFSRTTGQLTTAPPTLAFTGPNSPQIRLDFTGMTQLAGDFSLDKPVINGNAPSAVDRVEIGDDGTLNAVFDDGSQRAIYRLPLATVASPDNLAPLAGNVYEASLTSGAVQVGFPQDSGFGAVQSKALERSNVDLVTELTLMIESQRAYTANSKVFQTGADLLDVLVNLKR